jgi:hypothetical protein
MLGCVATEGELLMRLRSLLLLFSLLLILALPAAAQEPEHPLAQMFAVIPQSRVSESGSFISYVDYRAAFSQRGGSFSANSREFSQLLGDDDARALWMANALRVASGMPDWTQYLMQIHPEAVELLGFEWFDIDQSLSFGVPPTDGAILRGEFDAERVRAAFEARDFAAETIDGVKVLCWIEGCDQGLAMDVRSRNPANPFGGNLGRREPVALLPNLLLNSAEIETVTGMIAAATGAAPSLLDDPDYAAIADLISELGAADVELIQLHIYRQADIVDFSVPESLASVVDTLGPLPPYSIAALADLQDGETQIALAALVYETAEPAETAAGELTARIASFDSRDEFTEAQVEIDSSQVFTSAAGDRFVAVGSLRYPLPSNDSSDDTLTQSGLIYRRWLNGFFRREFYPVVSTS